MSMHVIGARWTESVNLLHVQCECGRKFLHVANRWRVICPSCNREDDLSRLRAQYV